jgi:hypothetical protein
VGQSITINSTSYTIVGLVNPTLTGDVSDIYFSLSNLQTLSTNTGRINEVLVSVANAKDVNSVAKAIKAALPGATVLTSASLADQVTGSLTNARKLANDLGGALAVVVLLAAFLIAGLLTCRASPSGCARSGRCAPSAGPADAWCARSWPRRIGIGVVGGVVGDRRRCGDLPHHRGHRSLAQRLEYRTGRGGVERELPHSPDDVGDRGHHRAPQRADQVAHHRHRLRRRPARRTHRRGDRRLARGATVAGVGPAGPRIRSKDSTMTQTLSEGRPSSAAGSPLYELRGVTRSPSPRAG